jgi:hypothetical protein
VPLEKTAAARTGTPTSCRPRRLAPTTPTPSKTAPTRAEAYLYHVCVRHVDATTHLPGASISASTSRRFLPNERTAFLATRRTGWARCGRERPYATPASLVLLQNAPNPVQSRHHIRFRLPQTERVELNVYDVKGRPCAPWSAAPWPLAHRACVERYRDQPRPQPRLGVYFTGDFSRQTTGVHQKNATPQGKITTRHRRRGLAQTPSSLFPGAEGVPRPKMAPGTKAMNYLLDAQTGCSAWFPQIIGWREVWPLAQHAEPLRLQDPHRTP